MSEHTFVLGQEQHLIATLTPAAPGTPACQWVAILTNSGVIPRMGSHRMNVRLARQFAQMGIPSIRFDMSGLGDSRRAHSGMAATQQWVADTRAVMDAAQQQLGPSRFFMIGFCSGAEVAHLTALEDDRLQAALLWDFYAFPTPLSRIHGLLYKIRRAGVRGLLAELSKHIRTRHLSQSKTTEPVTPPEVYMDRFQKLVDQGVELFFYYSGGEPIWYAYRGQFHDMFKGREFIKHVAFDQLDISDHLITTKQAQEAFMDAVQKWLTQRVLR